MSSAHKVAKATRLDELEAYYLTTLKPKYGRYTMLAEAAAKEQTKLLAPLFANGSLFWMEATDTEGKMHKQLFALLKIQKKPRCVFVDEMIVKGGEDLNVFIPTDDLLFQMKEQVIEPFAMDKDTRFIRKT